MHLPSRLRRPTLHRLGWCALALAVLSGCIALFVRHNDFPIDYHPDTVGKVVQLSADQWNFRHPHLLMTVTRAIEPVVGWFIGPVEVSSDRWLFEPALPADAGAWLRAGRVASALMGAGTVVLLAAVAGLQYGRLAALLTGALLMWSHALMVRAHYVKEDTALLMGFSAVALALTLWERRPGWSRAAGVGLACGVAASAKYVGLIALPAALAMLVLARLHAQEAWPTRRRLLAAGLALLTGAATFAAINFEAVADPSAFLAGVSYEAKHVTSSHFGVVPAHPALFYLGALMHELTIPVLVLGLAGALWLAAQWHRLTPAQQAVLIFPPLLQLVITLGSAVHMDRYALPLVVWWHVMAAVGLVELARRAPLAVPTRHAAGLTAAVAVLAISVSACLDLDDSLRQDSRKQLNDWIATHMPRRANILAEAYARIRPASARAGGHVVAQTFHAVRFDDLQTMRRKGYTHVVVCDLAFDRYISGHFRGEAPESAGFTLMAERYRQLFDEAQLVWSSQPGAGRFGYTDPRIYVFRLSGDLPERN